MASYYVSPFLFLLLLLSVLIQESQQQSCPESFYFNCPDNVHNNGKFPSSLFTNTSLHDHPYCDGPCELTCHHDHTMIKCNESSPDPPYLVLDINPIDLTIAVDYPAWPDLEYDLCKAYAILNVSFPGFRFVNLTTSGETETLLGCPYTEDGKDDSGDSKVIKYCVEDDHKVVILYTHGQLPAGKPRPAGCIQFPVYNAAQPASMRHPDDSYAKGGKAQPPIMGDPDDSYAKGGKGKRLKIILSSVLSVVAAIALLALIVYWRQTKNKPGSTTLPSRIMSLDYTRSGLEEGSINKGVTIYSFAELQEITNNFDPARELGEGGFGVVYHGKLKDGREVAVKRMFEKNYVQIQQFKNEIKILTDLRHPNLVTLYGSTSRHSRELLLVYEYVPNGTVADHLHGDQSKSVLLLWPTRMKIAIETAAALCYLHFKDIVHRDIKTNNILLDRSFCAKVADFGLSRLFPADVTHVSTAPQGTPGYLDPEYHQCYHLTDRSDVYSFGVVLIELISSMPAVDLGRDRHEVNLSNYAMNRIQSSAFGELVDPNLGYEKSFKVRRMTTLVAELAFRCLQHERELRPSMDEVLEALKRIESVDYDGLEAEEMG